MEVEVKYNDKNYEVEIEHDSGEPYTAEIEDDVNNEYKKGQDAFDELYPMLENLDENIGYDSAKDDVLNETRSAFNLDENYDEIEVEFDYFDHDDEQEFEEK